MKLLSSGGVNPLDPPLNNLIKSPGMGRKAYADW